MARWTILLFSLCVVLNGEEIELSTVQRCCQDGRDWALAGKHCTATPPISSSDTCNISKEQCCSAAVRDTLCDKGIKMAEWQGACETPFFQGERWEIQISKSCCDCCALGLMTASRSSSCNFQGLFLLETCLHTARVCCKKSSTAENKPTENELELQAVKSCCQDGRHRAYLGQYCATLAFSSSSSYSCSITKEKCCSAAIGEWFCNNGIERAKENGTCHGLSSRAEQWEFQISKMCCDCCLLGLMTASQNSSCDLQGFSPGRQCLDTAKACCENKTTVIQPTTNEPNHQFLRRCCNDGKKLARSDPNCAVDYSVSSVDQCRFLTEKCCQAAVTDDICKMGIERAGTYEVCDSPHLPAEPPRTGVLSEICCECCKFGHLQAPNCRFRNLALGSLCLDAAVACCETTETNSTTVDVDECLSGAHMCQSDEVCINTVGSYKCQKDCGIGFELNNDTCQDINECKEKTHNCPSDVSCFNTLGGFRCLSMTCPRYFQLARKGQYTSAGWSCYKSCHPYDVHCYKFSIDMIHYMCLSLPTFRNIMKPEEIIFLQSTAVAEHAHLPGATDVYFQILVADEESSFDVIKRPYLGMLIGVVRQVKPIQGPRDIVLQVAMNYVKSGVVSYRLLAIIHVFISESLH